MLNDDGIKLPVLTRTCPSCGNSLVINVGLYGLVYICSTHGVVTEEVERVFSASTEEVITGTISDFPRELQRFSWAAFLFCWIWAFARGLWLWGIIMFFIPFLVAMVFLPFAVILIPACWVFYFCFGFNANRLDWEKNSYLNAHEFRLSHRRWEVFMKFFLAFIILIILIMIFGLKFF